MAQGEGGGRPTKYETKMNRRVYKFALLGASDKEMADALEISEATLYNWKNDYPKFLEAINKGKIDADANVSDSLYKKACGFTQGGVYFPPDTAAMNIWLKNRRSKVPEGAQRWADKHETGLTDKDGNDVPIIFNPVPGSTPIEIKGNE